MSYQATNGDGGGGISKGVTAKRGVCCLAARSAAGAGVVERSSWPMAPPFRCQIRRRTKRLK